MKTLRVAIYVIVGIVGILGIVALLVWLKVIPINKQSGDYSDIPDTKNSFVEEIQNSPVPASANTDKAQFVEQIGSSSSTTSNTETQQRYEESKTLFLQTVVE